MDEVALENRLRSFLTQSQVDKVLEELSVGREHAIKPTEILTIVTNKGVHFIDEEQLRGRVIYASEGQLDLSSAKVIHEQYRAALSYVAEIVKSKHWHQIYLLPTGPSTLSLNIKALVRQITGKDSVDLFTDRVSGKTWEIELDVRAITSEAGSG